MIVIILFIAAVGAYWYFLSDLEHAQGNLASSKVSPQLTSALTYADRLYGDKNYIAAERGYVAVLKLDHKNLHSYNRLGMIYTAQKNFPDAIECFEVTTRLRPGATSYFNLGLAFYENGNYIKANSAIRKSIMFEPSTQRYIGLAKVCDKIADNKSMIEALESAVELESNRQTLTLLRDAYSQIGKTVKVDELTKKIKALVPNKPVKI